MSSAINGVIEGIKEKFNDPEFEFDMYDYGAVALSLNTGKPICIGCLATVAIHHGYNLKAVDFNAQCDYVIRKSVSARNITKYLKHKVDIDFDELDNFEQAMNDVRLSYVSGLVRFYGKTDVVDRFKLNEFINWENILVIILLIIMIFMMKIEEISSSDN